MTSPHARFVDFITRGTEVLGLPEPTIPGDSYMFRVGDRWLEIKLNAEKAVVVIAAVACAFGSSTPPRTDLVAAFNLDRLFNGGHALVVDEEQGLIRLCRCERLSVLRPQHIRADLVAFSRMAAMAGTWYLRAAEEQQSTGHPVPWVRGVDMY